MDEARHAEVCVKRRTLSQDGRRAYVADAPHSSTTSITS
jgi:hypothetical protein